MRDAQGAERHLDRAEHAEHHRGVDVAHVSDPERAALQVADPAAQDDAALLATIVAERARLAALHEHRGHRVRALLGADDVERERASAHRLTAWRVASASSAWRRVAASKPSSNSMSSALRKPKSRCCGGVPPYFW